MERAQTERKKRGFVVSLAADGIQCYDRGIEHASSQAIDVVSGVAENVVVDLVAQLAWEAEER